MERSLCDTLDEVSEIARTSVENPDSAAYGTKGGRTTTDRVFLLSIGILMLTI